MEAQRGGRRLRRDPARGCSTQGRAAAQRSHLAEPTQDSRFGKHNSDFSSSKRAQSLDPFPGRSPSPDPGKNQALRHSTTVHTGLRWQLPQEPAQGPEDCSTGATRPGAIAAQRHPVWVGRPYHTSEGTGLCSLAGPWRPDSQPGIPGHLPCLPWTCLSSTCTRCSSCCPLCMLGPATPDSTEDV